MPEIMLLATDAQKHLIKKPLVAQLWSASLQSVGEQPAEAQAPDADAFVADHDATGGEDCLDVAQAEARAVIQPHRMLDDLGRKAKAAVRVRRCGHIGQAAMQMAARQADKAPWTFLRALTLRHHLRFCHLATVANILRSGVS
jgi:hypothetical protein